MTQIGGAHPNALLSACEVLNWTLPEETAKWEKLPDYMHVPRSGHAVVILNNEMYAVSETKVKVMNCLEGRLILN